MQKFTVIETANLDAVSVVTNDDGTETLSVLLKGRLAPVFIHDEDETFKAYKALFMLKKVQLDQYLENLENKED